MGAEQNSRTQQGEHREQEDRRSEEQRRVDELIRQRQQQGAGTDEEKRERMNRWDYNNRK